MRTIVRMKKLMLTIMLATVYLLMAFGLLAITAPASKAMHFNPNPSQYRFVPAGLNTQFPSVPKSVELNLPGHTSIVVTTPVTLSAFSAYTSQFSKNGVNFCYKVGGGGGGRGLNIAVINPISGVIESCSNFDTWSNKQAFVTLADYISNTIPTDSIVLIAIADEGGFIRYSPPESNCHTPWVDSRVELGYQALESLGSTQIRQVGYWGSWAMIAIKGQGALLEAYHDPVYNPPANGFCQLQSRVSTLITATVPIITESPPEWKVYLPVVLKNYNP